MKIFNNIGSPLLCTGLLVLLLASSCQKGFKPDTYQPLKPLQTFDGYGSSNAVAKNNLVGYWPFSNSIADSISNTTGTATGTSFTTGINGQALQGADNSYALCGAPAGTQALQSISVSIWVKTAAPSSGRTGFFSIANTQTLHGNIEMFFENGSTNTNGTIVVHLSQNGVDYTFTPSKGLQNLFDDWVNIIFTYSADDGSCYLYINGKTKTSGSAVDNNGNSLSGPLAFTNVGNVVFGALQYMTTPSQTSASSSGQSTASFFTGAIDQVRLYNAAISRAQASALYSLEVQGR
jgi:hypothetical protein